MVIHIIPIGVNTEHVEEGLKEIIPVEKVYLLHSKNGKAGEFKGFTMAKKLKKYLEPHFGPIILEEIDAFEMSSVYLKIQEIIRTEVKESAEGVLIKSNFAVGITGGTNPMACGAIIGATLSGVDAYYVRNRNFEPNRKLYAEKLLLPSKEMMGNVKGTNLEILEILSEGTYVDNNDEIILGMMTRTKLIKKTGKDANTINSAIKVLKNKELVKQYDFGIVKKNKEERIGYPPIYKNVKQKFVRYEITQNGKFQIQMNSTLTEKEIKAIKNN
jgi:hypothetical protein